MDTCTSIFDKFFINGGLNLSDEITAVVKDAYRSGLGHPASEELTVKVENRYTDYAKESISSVVKSLYETFNLKLSNRNRLLALFFTEYYILNCLQFKVILFDNDSNKFREIYIIDPKSLMVLKGCTILAITLKTKANDDDYASEQLGDIIFFNDSFPVSVDLCYDNVVDYASEDEMYNDDSFDNNTFYLKEINSDKLSFKNDIDNSIKSFTTFDEIYIIFLR